jgi:hypothetical protein
MRISNQDFDGGYVRLGGWIIETDNFPSAYLIFSSACTNFPKGAPLSHTHQGRPFSVFNYRMQVRKMDN